ncbi:hypothetical protein AWW66_11265 [Micromonospora rosaria]|uniref:Uncharacterized protein n=1 Tax=Micromonospora rosaria TaxID=47874 RepID=A0A136PUS1_9ACTN|nr:hypothetical protein [Micromonospora rosaria]KXK61906.1 hypothetical protein AWW66_11265 [Micromonospora rosaria]
MSVGRFVVHLPVAAEDLDVAKRYARVISRAVGFLGNVDRAETTVSYEDAQGVHHRVFCDRLLAAGRRCPRAAGHGGDCAPAARR